MEVVRINNDSFGKWEKQIEELINESVKINFPEQDAGDSYGRDKCKQLKDYLEKGVATVIAIVEGEDLLGWIWCHQIYRLKKRRLHVSEIGVADQSQGKGIGQRLLREAEAFAKENGFEEIDLFVTASNERAVNFYEKSAYTPERFLMKKRVD